MRNSFVKGLFVFLIIITGASIASADTWVKTIDDIENSWYWYGSPMANTIDGGFVIAAKCGSQGVGVIKLDEYWNIQWQKVYGETGTERAYIIRQTSDSGYIITGSTIAHFT